MTPLDMVQAHYHCQIALIDYLEERVKPGSDSFFEKIKLPGFADLPTRWQERSIEIHERISVLRTHVEDMAFLALVAAFEMLVFARIELAGEKIRSMVEAGYHSDQPLYAFRLAFVRDHESFRNLGGLRELLGDDIRITALAQDIKAIIDYRDYIAHGKRFKKGEVNRMVKAKRTPRVDTTKVIFDQIMDLL